VAVPVAKFSISGSLRPKLFDEKTDTKTSFKDVAGSGRGQGRGSGNSGLS
jgi:hypothetical protein